MGVSSQSYTIRILLCYRKPWVQTEQKYISKVNILTSLRSLEFGFSKGIGNLNLSLFFSITFCKEENEPNFKAYTGSAVCLTPIIAHNKGTRYDSNGIQLEPRKTQARLSDKAGSHMSPRCWEKTMGPPHWTPTWKGEESKRPEYIFEVGESWNLILFAEGYGIWTSSTKAKVNSSALSEAIVWVALWGALTVLCAI